MSNRNGNPIEIPPEVAESLGYYVYLYTDPRNGEIRYVGKGTGNRAVSHMADTRQSKKVKWIKELREAGREPRIEILARNLTEREALHIERSVIDVIGIQSLTNAVRGHNIEHGRELLKEIIIREAAEEAYIRHSVLIFRINRTFRLEMTEKEIYEFTRGIWVIGEERRRKALYAFGVSNGIVRGVFSVDRWHKGGTTEYCFRKFSEDEKLQLRKRWEFTSNEKPPEEIIDMYLHKSVRKYFSKGMQSPVVFVEGNSGN